MKNKTYGIKTHLAEEFKPFKISRQKSAMAFLGNCTLLINAMAIRTRVETANRVISITSFPLFEMGLVEFRISPQRFDLIFSNMVPIALNPALKIYLFFDSDDQKI